MVFSQPVLAYNFGAGFNRQAIASDEQAAPRDRSIHIIVIAAAIITAVRSHGERALLILTVMNHIVENNLIDMKPRRSRSNCHWHPINRKLNVNNNALLWGRRNESILGHPARQRRVESFDRVLL